MSEQQPHTGTRPEPIFIIDIECPRCAYNLRGLIEPRCPECGNTFDPQDLMKLLKRLPGPGMLWALPRMIGRPVAFWSLPKVRDSFGPGYGSLYRLLLFATLLAVAIACVASTVWELNVRIEPFLRGLRRHVRGDAVWGAFMAVPVLAFGGFLFCLVHQLVCELVLRHARIRDPAGAAKAIVAYSSLWILLAAPAWSGCLFWIRHRVPVFNVGCWLQVLGALSLLTLVLATVCWARTLCEAGRSVAAGRTRCGLWCAFGNPFWYSIACSAYAAWSH